MKILKKAGAAAAITLIAGSAQALTCSQPPGLRSLTVTPAVACGPMGLGNVQDADIYAFAPTATIIERDESNGNGGTLSITGEGGSSGSWSFLASVLSSYTSVYLGFHFGNGGDKAESNPDWFIVQVGANSGSWSIDPTKWALSNIVLFGVGATTSSSSSGGSSSGSVPEPASTALVGVGLGLLGVGFARRRKTAKA